MDLRLTPLVFDGLALTLSSTDVIGLVDRLDQIHTAINPAHRAAGDGAGRDTSQDVGSDAELDAREGRRSASPASTIGSTGTPRQPRRPRGVAPVVPAHAPRIRLG